jgi:hypothetical protein
MTYTTNLREKEEEDAMVVAGGRDRDGSCSRYDAFAPPWRAPGVSSFATHAWKDAG